MPAFHAPMIDTRNLDFSCDDDFSVQIRLPCLNAVSRRDQHGRLRVQVNSPNGEGRGFWARHTVALQTILRVADHSDWTRLNSSIWDFSWRGANLRQ